MPERFTGIGKPVLQGFAICFGTVFRRFQIGESRLQFLVSRESVDAFSLRISFSSAAESGSLSAGLVSWGGRTVMTSEAVAAISRRVTRRLLSRQAFSATADVD